MPCILHGTAMRPGGQTDYAPYSWRYFDEDDIQMTSNDTAEVALFVELQFPEALSTMADGCQVSCLSLYARPNGSSSQAVLGEWKLPMESGLTESHLEKAFSGPQPPN